MRHQLRQATRAALLASVLATAGFISAPHAASADEVGTQGWRGPCSVSSSSTSFGGWCDGNGPEGYQAWIRCSNGVYYSGVRRWYGDRRGSWVTCPAPYTITWKEMGHELP